MLKHFHCTRNFLGQIYINILNAGPIYHVKVNTLDLKIYVHIFIFMYTLDAVSHFYHLKLHYFFPSYFIKWYLFMWNNLPDEPPMKWRFKGGGANITKKNQNSSTSQISSQWMLSAKLITSQKLKNQYLFLEIWSIL